MAQPTAYDRQASFSNIQAQAPSDPLPGATIDAEFNAVKETLDETLANLALIQRDDGALANGSVGLDQLSEDIEVGWQAPEVWVTATAYVSGDTVFNGSAFYRLLVAHTAGTFATDLAAGKWEEIVDLSGLAIVDASQIANTPAGSIAATTVQAAIDELASEKAASSHTHPSSALTDSTAAGRSMLAAATAAAQRTLLGLGALALEDTVSITDLGAQLALSGIIEPSALAADQNDWAPTGIATCSTIRVSASTSGVDITGLLAGTDGEIKVIENIGATYAVTLLPSNASSAAANRFLIPKPIAVRPNQSVVLKYDADATTPRWRVIAPISAQPVAGGYKNLLIVNGATADEQMTVTADAITLEDSSGDVYRATSVSVTASNIVSGANGLDTGAVATSTWYSLWVIYNPTTNTLAALLSTSATAPTMPSGYTFKARVHWNKTDGSSDFYRVRQMGRSAYFNVTAATNTAAFRSMDTGDSAASPTAGNYKTIAVGGYVPSTASHIHCTVMTNYNAATSANVVLAATNAHAGPSSTNPPALSLANGGTTMQSVTLPLMSTNIYWDSDNNGGALFCRGWEDNL